MLFLSNADLNGLLGIEESIRLIEKGYHEAAIGRGAQFPEGGRMDVVAPSPGPEEGRRFIWGAMAGVVPEFGMFALRVKFDIQYSLTHPDGAVTQEKYCREPGTFCGLILLARIDNAEPVAILNDGVLQHLRVGATTGIAAKYLARPDSRVVGMLGSGGMARTYSAAYCTLLPIERIQVYSPTPAHREAFAEEMSTRLEIPVVVAATPYEAVKGADIVADCTDSSTPIFEDAAWVRDGMHLATFGADRLGAEAVRRASLSVRHFEGPVAVYADPELAERSEKSWRQRNPASVGFEHMPLLVDVIGGQTPGRTDERQVTCFYNVGGSALQFAAIGPRVYQLALERGLGREIPTEWLLQDIRD